MVSILREHGHTPLFPNNSRYPRVLAGASYQACTNTLSSLDPETPPAVPPRTRLRGVYPLDPIAICPNQ